MATAEQIQNEMDLLLANMARLDNIVNGSGNVTTTGGTVPSISKFFADVEADAYQLAGDNSGFNYVRETWAALLSVTGSSGERAIVWDGDNGSHSAASATGYDGASTPNAGRYSWNNTWRRWQRLGDTGYSALNALINDVRARVNDAGVFFATATGTNDIVLTLKYLPSLTEGVRVGFFAPATTTAAATISANGSPARPANKPEGGQLAAGEIVGGRWYEFCYDLPGNVWTLTADVNLPRQNKANIAKEIADRTAADNLKMDLAVRNSLSLRCSVGGTADAIALTSSYAQSSPLTDGQEVHFKVATTNTGPVTVSLNGGAAFNVRHPVSNSTLGAGLLQAGRTYTLAWQSSNSSWYVRGIGDQIYGKATQTVLKPTATGGVATGTANAIEVATDFNRVDGSMLIFKAASTNTISNVTLSVNGASPTLIRHANTLPLRVGDIAAGRWYLVRFDATGGNPWILISSGVTLGDVQAVAGGLAALGTRVGLLEAASGGRVVFASEAQALMDKINGPRMDDADWETSLRNPDHTTGATTGTTRISWSDGVRSEEAPAVIKSLGFGSSIDESGAGSGDSATYTPSIMFVDKLRKRFALYRNVDFQQSNVAVGGQTIGQMLAQIQGAAAGDYDIIVGGNPMNSGGISDTAGAATMRSFRANLENVVDEIRNVRNAVPILTPTFHPHIYYSTSGVAGGAQTDFPDNYRSAWPRGNTTYQVNANHEFDGSGGRIKLVNISLYGSTLADGDTLYVPSGSAAGTYTIATGGIDWATGWVTVNEAIPYTGTYSVQVTNTAADEERVVWPPLSERIQTIDRTGRGLFELPGFVTYDETNRIYHEVGHIKDCMIADLEYAQFRFLERKLEASPSLSDSDLYDTMYVQGGVRQANHPNAEFYGFAYGGTWAALANAIHTRTLHQSRIVRLAA